MKKSSFVLFRSFSFPVYVFHFLYYKSYLETLVIFLESSIVLWLCAASIISKSPSLFSLHKFPIIFSLHKFPIIYIKLIFHSSTSFGLILVSLFIAWSQIFHVFLLSPTRLLVIFIMSWLYRSTGHHLKISQVIFVTFHQYIRSIRNQLIQSYAQSFGNNFLFL